MNEVYARLSMRELIELTLTSLTIHSTVSILAVTEISINLVNTRSSV